MRGIVQGGTELGRDLKKLPTRHSCIVRRDAIAFRGHVAVEPAFPRALALLSRRSRPAAHVPPFPSCGRRCGGDRGIFGVTTLHFCSTEAGADAGCDTHPLPSELSSPSPSAWFPSRATDPEPSPAASPAPPSASRHRPACRMAGRPERALRRPARPSITIRLRPAHPSHGNSFWRSGARVRP